MAYIVLLNPLIRGGFSADAAPVDLARHFLPAAAVGAATGLAAGLGINSFLAVSVIGDVTWPEAVGMALPNGSEFYFADTSDSLGPRGAKSMSESPFNPVAPALANALRDATGIRFASTPFRRDDVYLALEAAGLVPPLLPEQAQVGDLVDVGP